MKHTFSRRSFLKTTAMALGSVLVFDFQTVAGAKQISGLRTTASTEMGEKNMPHVIVKLWPGPSEQDKARLAEAIVEDVMEFAGVGEGSVSVAIEEVSPSDWKTKVYDPDIKKNMDKLYKKPGYSM